MRHSLAFVGYKERKALAASLKAISQSATDQEAECRLEEFEQQWNDRYPLIGQSWRRNWPRLIPMFGYPQEIRRAIYTTNSIESLKRSLRKTLKIRASFPSEEAAFKLRYLALRNAQKKWTRPIPNWGRAMNAFAILPR